MPPKKSEVIELRRIVDEVVEIEIEGITPVIPHKWSEKSRRMMRDKQMGKAKTKKPPKDPEADAEACLYRLDDGRLGIPATAFKGAIIGACRLFEGLTMVSTKIAVFVEGEGQDQLVPIEGDTHFREDPCRNESGVCDLRHRYAIWPWKATIRVRYLPSQITKESVVNLVDAAGRGGVGDWRPSAPKSHTGTYGQFRVTT